MATIAVTLAEGPIDFPAKGCRFAIEENVGDEKPIHIHFGKGPAQVNAIEWNVRLHFTYQEYREFCRLVRGEG